MSKEPKVADQDKFVLRLPDGMRERISKSAQENGRSMNAEIVQALEQFFPAEPTIEDVLDKVHAAISQAKSVNGLPYRQVLVDTLDELSERLSSGIEFKQTFARTEPPHAAGIEQLMRRLDRWRRAEKHGVEQDDLERELQRGLLHHIGRDRASTAIQRFKEGRPEKAMSVLRLESVKFADVGAAYTAIEDDLRQYYEKNWHDDPEQPDFD